MKTGLTPILDKEGAVNLLRKAAGSETLFDETYSP
jgi:hypothetical protein